MPSGPPRRAFADESFLEADQGGYYILAAAIIAPESGRPAREAMLALNGARTSAKLHWNDLDRRQREHAAQAVAKLDGFHLVVVGSPVPARRQERARAMCLARLVVECHGLDVRELVLESRSQALNARDLKTVIGARYLLPKGADLTVTHAPGFTEPLLWIADIVAGAVRLHHQGDGRCRDALEGVLLELAVDTGC